MELIAAVVIVAIGGTIPVVMSWRFARSWCRPRRAVARIGPASFGLPFETVSFPSGSLVLRGWFVPPITPRAPGVILAHAWSTNGAQMLVLARRLHESGLAVLMFDARGHGSSDGRGFVTIMSLASDLSSAVDYLERRPEVVDAQIAVVGHSMGGASAIVAASIDHRIRAVASIAAFADSAKLTEAALAQDGYPRWPFVAMVRLIIEIALRRRMSWASPAARIGDLRGPVLLLQGAVDRLVPASDHDLLSQRAPDTVVARLLPRRDHFDILRDAACADALVGFLGPALSTADVPTDEDRLAHDGVAPIGARRIRQGPFRPGNAPVTTSGGVS